MLPVAIFYTIISESHTLLFFIDFFLLRVHKILHKMSMNSDRKRMLEPASAMIDDPSLRCDPAPLSSTQRKRRKREAKKFNVPESKNQSNPMGYNKIKMLIEIEDPTKFVEQLELLKVSFIMQFDTKQKLGHDHLAYIAESLIRIKALPQKDYWCTLIDEKIAEFIKIQIIPNVIPQLKMTQEVFEQFKQYDKINEYFGKLALNANKNHQQPTTSARVNEIQSIANVSMDALTDEDFRMMPIIPTTSEILNVAPFIEKNIVTGNNDNIEHYLDVQFRLFREDIIEPLRNDIKQYRHYIKMTANKDDFSIKGSKLYRNVKICDPRISQSGYTCQCKFSSEQFGWKHNKRIMAGSLVCFSSNDFESFFFATLSIACSPEELCGGRFKICLESMCIPDCNISYNMIESQVYFEAYRYNLKVLQELNGDNFPFKKYIVDLDGNILPPSYLTNNPNYTISNGLPASNPESKTFPINILSEEAWPTPEDLHMDQSQYDAYFAALTKQN